MPDMTDAYQWHGRTMVGSDGEKLGKISEIYEDPQTGKPEWATVSSGLFGTKSNFVPLAGAVTDGEDVRADVTKDQVKGAPGVENDGELSEEEERGLFQYYGVPYTDQGSVTAQGQPSGGQYEKTDAQKPILEKQTTRKQTTQQKPIAARSVMTPAVRRPMTR